MDRAGHSGALAHRLTDDLTGQRSHWLGQGCATSRTSGSTRAIGAIGAMVAIGMLVGCTTPVRVTPLATGRADAAAFRLFGADLADLQAQAQRLCPEGHQTWQAHQSGTPKADAVLLGSPTLGASVASWQRAIGQTQASAQMLVVCRQNPMGAVAAAQLAQARPAMPATMPPEAAAPTSDGEAASSSPAAAAPAVVAGADKPPASAALPKGRGEPATAPVTGYDR